MCEGGDDSLDDGRRSICYCRPNADLPRTTTNKDERGVRPKIPKTEKRQNIYAEVNQSTNQMNQ